MTPDGSAPLTRRAAREARRAAAGGGAAGGGADGAGSDAGTNGSGSHGTRPTGWQPPLRETDLNRDEVVRDEVVRDEVVRDEVVRDGVVRDGAAPDEVAPDDVIEDVVKALPEDVAAGPVAPAHEEDVAPADDDQVEADGSRRRRRTGGLAQAGAEEFSLAQAVGGVRGAAETLVPGLLFVLTYTLTRDLTIALAVSVGAALLAIVARVLTRSAPSQALSGAVGVGICAVFALWSGEARNFYLPGFLLNVGYGLLCLVSTVPFRRVRVPGTQRHVGPGPYPVIGLLLGPLTGEGLAWRRVPARLRVYQRVTWLWAGFFLLRLAVQVPLYLADLVGALGAARLAMGVPAFALMVWISWLLLRSVPRADPDGQSAD